MLPGRISLSAICLICLVSCILNLHVGIAELRSSWKTFLHYKEIPRKLVAISWNFLPKELSISADCSRPLTSAVATLSHEQHGVNGNDGGIATIRRGLKSKSRGAFTWAL
jgi:hypothetical protein